MQKVKIPSEKRGLRAGGVCDVCACDGCIQTILRMYYKLPLCTTAGGAGVAKMFGINMKL